MSFICLPRWCVMLLTCHVILGCCLTFIGPCVAKIFAEYNQQDVTFHNLFISVRRSTCFRQFFRPSSGAQNCTYSVRYWSDTVCVVLSCWWWKENPSETCRASYRNKSEKLCILLVVLCELVVVFVGVGTAKLVKLATHVSRSSVAFGHTVTEPTNSCYIIHGRYSITWPHVSVSRTLTAVATSLFPFYTCNEPPFDDRPE